MTGSVALEVGQTASATAVLAADAVDTFAELSGDDNPVHMNDAAARAAGFDRRVVHGSLAASLISRILGTQLPGPGTIYLSQTLAFRRPIYVGEAVSASVEIASVREDKPVITLFTRVHVGDELAIDGEAVVLFRGSGG